jgi:hypothetical protein
MSQDDKDSRQNELTIPSPPSSPLWGRGEYALLPRWWWEANCHVLHSSMVVEVGEMLGGA